MNHKGDCGSVVAVENIMNVARLAKDVMEKTPHVMLAGKGAEEFAISEGYKKINLLTETSKKDWEKWLENKEYSPIINIENHDTIGMLCLDKNNNMSGACTTSGLAYKMKGRIGDSPIIGSGLFIDNKIASQGKLLKFAGVKSKTALQILQAGYEKLDENDQDQAQEFIIWLNAKAELSGYSQTQAELDKLDQDNQKTA